MKYRIDYTIGNGYTCNCCSCYTPHSEMVDTYGDAIRYVANIHLNKLESIDEITPIPESPDDFIHDEVYNEYTVKFDRNQFDADVERLKSELILIRESEEKKKLEEELIKKKKEQEDRDRQEYLRLKAKYEGNQSNIEVQI